MGRFDTLTFIVLTPFMLLPFFCLFFPVLVVPGEAEGRVCVELVPQSCLVSVPDLVALLSSASPCEVVEVVVMTGKTGGVGGVGEGIGVGCLCGGSSDGWWAGST